MDRTLDGKTKVRIMRSDRIRSTVVDLDRAGKQPTSRNVLARMAGHDDVKKFPQGMGGADLLVFRDAMRDTGYVQVNSMWKKQVASVGLDEVLCDCPHSKYQAHVMTEHEETVRSSMVGVSFAGMNLANAALFVGVPLQRYQQVYDALMIGKDHLARKLIIDA